MAELDTPNILRTCFRSRIDRQNSFSIKCSPCHNDFREANFACPNRSRHDKYIRKEEHMLYLSQIIGNSVRELRYLRNSNATLACYATISLLHSKVAQCRITKLLSARKAPTSLVRRYTPCGSGARRPAVPLRRLDSNLSVLTEIHRRARPP